jgi:cytochrome c peroxidase
MTWSHAIEFMPKIHRRLTWSVCCAALLSSIVVAQPQLHSGSPQAQLADDQEPITPIPPPLRADSLKLALGERLFGDTRLSADGNLACSSCHDIRTSGADGGSSRTAKDGSTPSFDTLTIFNAALNFRLTWEGRFRTLESQAEASLENPANMHTSAADVVRKLNADPEMIKQFRVAYGHAPDRESFLDSLVTFENSLLTPGSRFDRWLGGDASALTASELEGYRMFKSLGCSSCHQGVNVGGNLFGRLGVFRQSASGPARSMRVPSLRNVATTAPYFHDGSAATLEEAVRRMATAQLMRKLTDEQITLLLAFLNTLTGNYRGKPVTEASP